MVTTTDADIFAELPRGRFGAGIVDFPWPWVTYSARGRGKCAERHYTGSLALDAIKALPLASLFKPDCAVAFWYPQAFVGEIAEVIRALGFTPKTQGTWVKLSRTGQRLQFGTGHILRSTCEYWVVATRGRPRVRSHRERNLIVAPVREHSRKPDELYGIMERLYGGPYVELFARHPWPGWTGWGDQLSASATTTNTRGELPAQELRGTAVFTARTCPSIKA
jgi:N6-adenosine-specific RNA methylase IME4